MLTPNQWHPPRDISGPDQDSLVQFQRDLAYGDGCFPAGANGRGLYPAESRPLLERGEEAIREARARGVEGRAELIHFPHRDDLQHFLEQSGGQGQLFQFDNSFSDVVVVLFT